MILVIGATGKVGMELVKALHTRGAKFRALAHSEASATKLTAQGITVQRGTIDQPDTLRSAMTGVEKLFLLTPSSPQQVAIENSLIDLAKQTRISHIVKLSVYDAGQRIAAYKGHGATEDHLKASGVAYTILRPNFFMQNFAANDAPTVIHNSAIFAPLGDAKISVVDARDIADVAAVTLTSADHQGQTYEITGATAYSYAEATAMLSQSIRKTVQYVDLPSEAYREALIKAGLPEWYASLLQELYADYHAGYGARISNDVQRITGHSPRGLQAYFDEYADTFR